MELKIKKLSKHAKIPERMTDGSSGFDLFACLPLQHCSLHHRGRILVPCGISLEIPPGYEGQIRPRSGLAAKSGITVLNAPGTIDSDYRGEVFVLLANLGGLFCRIEHGMRIAQIVFAPVATPDLIEVECLSTTERDAEGFGSTGE